MSEATRERPIEAAPPGGREKLPTQYRPSEHEARIREAWEGSGAFHPDPARVLRGEAKPYCIVIPPPNVTDRLHLGHALNNTLQDVLVRAHRMMGFETLWMPGTDHAGIATQTVVEKRLRAEGAIKGHLKQAMTREAFVAKVQAFKDEYEAIITGQLKMMGCSCDWERQRFTMDEGCIRAVYEAFFRLFRDGLIYRGKRLVNWDPVSQTALADDEVEMEEVEGKFYYLRYPLVHGEVIHPPGGKPGPEDDQALVPLTWSELRVRGYPVPEGPEYADERQAFVTVATTRPETYLGDTAVGVNPRDPRAKALRGVLVELPLVGRVIPIIEDDYVVMPKAVAERLGDGEAAADAKAEFATGFLKVTPAHDPNDYELGRRYDLAIINVMAPDASISDKHGWTDVGDAHIFVGKSREEARKLVVKEFQARALVEDIKPYRHSVGHSYRTHAAIEPYLSDQWYVKVTDERMAPAANRALVEDQKAAKQQSSKAANSEGDGTLRFYPARYAKMYEGWHEGIRDWCISRQLWWGHQIPVWSGSLLHYMADRTDLSGATFVANQLQLGPDQPGHAQVQDVFRLLRHWEEKQTIAILAASGEKLSLLTDSSEEATLRTLVSGHCHICVRPTEADASDICRVLEAIGFTRDPDVLDTWFSSGLWPMSTMGWPEETDLLKAFNPTDVLCTAREIITLWVSRMVMFNRYLRGQDLKLGEGRGPLPFRDVFIHCVVQDGEGRKMSKSLGNGVDPLDIIASHGADAMRFTIVQMATNTQDVRMPVVKDPATGRNTSPKFDLGRNFCNKLWNASRFALGILEAAAPGSGGTGVPPVRTLADRWMLSRLEAAVREVERCLREYSYAEYAQAVYDLLWRDFCDWYLEAIKPTVAADGGQRAVLAHALESIVRILHPIMPFITEAIWERVREVETSPVAGIELGPARKAGLLATAGWPRVAPSLRDEAAEREFEAMRSLVTAIREVRAQHNVSPKRRITLHLARALSSETEALVKTLAGVATVTTDRPAAESVPFSVQGIEHRLSDLTDAVDKSAESARLAKLVADLGKSVKTFQGRLDNPGYSEKAPPAMVQQTRDQLAKARAELAAAESALAALGA